MVLMRIRCCCSWDDFVVYVTVFKTFLFAGKENSFLSDSHLSTCEFVLYFVLLLSWSCLQGRQADFAAIFVQIHMYNICDASKKYLPFVSQKQCLSAVINTRGEFNPELPISQQSPELQVINCLCSSSKSCCEVCLCYHGKQEQYCSKNTLFSYICSLKTSQSPCHEFLGETWLSGHGQDGLMVGLMVSEVFSNLNSSMMSARSKSCWDTRRLCNKVRLKPTQLQKYLCVFINRASEIYSSSWVMVCLPRLMQSCPARQTPAPNLNPCDRVLHIGQT